MAHRNEDTVRVLRVIEYMGPRSEVERVVEASLHGPKIFGNVTIRGATIGDYPEILETAINRDPYA